MTEETVPLKVLFEKKLKEQWFSKGSKSPSKRKRLPENKYKTGFKNISKVYCQSCKNDFTYQYEYYDENDKRKYLTSVDFMVLKEKVLAKRLEWGVDSVYYARKTAKEVGLPLRNLKMVV